MNHHQREALRELSSAARRRAPEHGAPRTATRSDAQTAMSSATATGVRVQKSRLGANPRQPRHESVLESSLRPSEMPTCPSDIR